MQVVKSILVLSASIVVFFHAVAPHVHNDERHEHNAFSAWLNVISHAMENSHEDNHLEDAIFSDSCSDLERFILVDSGHPAFILTSEFILDEFAPSIPSFADGCKTSDNPVLSGILLRGPPSLII